MKIRFQADADLNHIILLATIRRQSVIDFQSAAAARLGGLNDREVLTVTAEQRRILVTHDRKTMPKHFGEFIVDNKSPGVIVVPQTLQVVSVADDLLLIWHATESEEWINRICFLPL
jgi:hypothetical protein